MFKEIQPENIRDNAFKLIGKDWMLITAGKPESFNTMTAAWGGFGFLWNKNVCFIFIRPNRYTYKFVEENSIFTLSFFEEQYRGILEFCGQSSGRDTDKIKKTGLTVFQSPGGGISFKEARTVIECRKIYFQDINPKNFADASIQNNYSEKDYHRMYTGEILHVFNKE
ncbi:MAG: flavin reductase [Candidatus Omnitrophica bacterium]|nr:flavin reductase [Candidatus Omnitrophota bacterium]